MNVYVGESSVMAEPREISMDHFSALVARARLDLSAQELESLKPMYDHYARQTAKLHEIDLAAEDLAVVFSPQQPSTAIP